MEDVVVKAYAQAMGVLCRAYKYRLDEKYVIMASKYPAKGFTLALTEAIKAKVVTQDDYDMIGAFINQIDGPLNDDDMEPISSRQACNWHIIFEQWKEVYTAKQAAEILGVTRQRIHALKKAGKLDYINVKGHDYFSGASVKRRAIVGDGEEPQTSSNS